MQILNKFSSSGVDRFRCNAAAQDRTLPRMTAGLTVLAIGAWISLAGAVRAENWPQWRGPQNSGVSNEDKAPTHWGPDKNVAWRLPLPGPAGSTPIVWHERIFLTSADQADLLLICIGTDGKEIWRRKVASGNRTVGLGSAEGNLASPSPATDGRHVWVFMGTGDLACFDFDGNMKWNINLQEKYGPFDLQFGMHSTPVLHKDRLYLQVIHGPQNANGEPAYVVAFDKMTGREAWKRDRKTDAKVECKHSYASPIVYDDGKLEFLITHGGDYVMAHRLSDGKEIWRHGGMNPPKDFGKAADGDNDSTASRTEPGLIERFDSNKDGTVTRAEIPDGPTRRVFDRLLEQHKLDPARSYTVAELRKATGANADQKKTQRGGYNPTLRFVASPVAADGLIVVPSAKKGNVLGLLPDLAGDATDSNEAKVWTLPNGTPDVPSPLVVDGLVYLASEDGVLTCLDAKTGKIHYRERLHGAKHRSSPMAAAGCVFVPAFDGTISVVKAGPKFELVAQNKLGETITASPALANGTLYLRSFDALWAIR